MTALLVTALCLLAFAALLAATWRIGTGTTPWLPAAAAWRPVAVPPEFSAGRHRHPGNQRARWRQPPAEVYTTGWSAELRRDRQRLAWATYLGNLMPTRTQS